METTTLKIANWNELKGKLKQKYPILTDAELVYTAGKEAELLSGLSKKLGKTEEEISDIIDELQGSQKEAVKPSESSKTESGLKEKKEAMPTGVKESE
ncbi:MAG: hypothetical protein A3F72_04180 [Bacteroidetes bacterium RIFCSPLOWO2_12_FULL_35_15]|nr:MAG: hypothetical protein A3F72_04180 [Bacteroidetes bacterium RIFCSPLOWO2_12_FULL_35_15]